MDFLPGCDTILVTLVQLFRQGRDGGKLQSHQSLDSLSELIRSYPLNRNRSYFEEELKIYENFHSLTWLRGVGIFHGMDEYKAVTIDLEILGCRQ